MHANQCIVLWVGTDAYIWNILQHVQFGNLLSCNVKLKTAKNTLPSIQTAYLMTAWIMPGSHITYQLEVILYNDFI